MGEPGERPDRGQRPVVAVVGGGMGGLCAARALARRGDVDVVVYERSDRPGGVLHTSRVDGFVREHAANGFLPVRQGDGALDLAAELGVAVAEAAPAARKRWIYRNGALHALPAGPGQFLASGLMSWRGKLAVLAEPLRPRRKHGHDQADESIHDFVSRRLGPEIAEAVVAPFVTGVFAGNADELSVEAGFPALVALEEQGGLIVGQVRMMIRTMLRRKREARMASQQPGPAQADSQKSSRRGFRLAAPVGGTQALVDALAAELATEHGRSLITGVEVTAVEPGPAGPRLRFADGSERAVSAVVLATPAHASARLVAQASPELAAVLGDIPYAPIAIAYLGARRADIAHPLDGFGFLAARGEALRMLGTVFESVLWNDRAPADHVLLRCMFGGARDPGALELDDRALIDTARADLDRALGGFAGVELVHSHVVRWPRAIAQYTLGHQQRVARAETLARPLGITLAGSAYHGVAVNRIVADARRVAGAVMAQLGAAATVIMAVLVMCALAMTACAGGNKTAPDSLPADDAPVDDAPVASDRARSPESRPSQPVAGDSGRVNVQVIWPDAPAELRRPAGRNPCGAWRAAPVRVHTLGGVAGAVVELRAAAPGNDADATPGAESAAVSGRDSASPAVEIAVRACAIEPRVAVLPRGAELVIRNHDERRHSIALAPAEGAPKYRAELPLIGALVAVRPYAPDGEPARASAGASPPGSEPNAMWRLSPAIDDQATAWVIAPGHGRAAVTDAQGAAHFDPVPDGAYEVVVWHPPVTPGQPALEARRPIAVTRGQTTSATLALRSP